MRLARQRRRIGWGQAAAPSAERESPVFFKKEKEKKKERKPTTSHRQVLTLDFSPAVPLLTGAQDEALERRAGGDYAVTFF